MKTWMVRAGRDAAFIDEFRDAGRVSIGWSALGPLTQYSTREDLARAVEKCWPEWHRQAQAMATGQVWRFKAEMALGDTVISYDPSLRSYLVGEISGPYKFDPANPEQPNALPVRWIGDVGRDLLSASSKNSLGAISTIFLVPTDTAADISRALKSREPAEVPDVVEAEEELIAEDMQAKALEFVKDRAAKLDWDQMQRLVAGLLRAMGYKTRVSPAGPDRGKDIIASPDGLGFESPRIVVEVKHRSGAMGSQEIRSFLGGRHKDDKGLYVSTGGFTKDARYEAERASIPLSLMDIDELVEALIENYEALDNETKQLLPLRRLYWPL